MQSRVLMFAALEVKLGVGLEQLVKDLRVLELRRQQQRTYAHHCYSIHVRLALYQLIYYVLVLRRGTYSVHECCLLSLIRVVYQYSVLV